MGRALPGRVAGEVRGVEVAHLAGRMGPAPSGKSRWVGVCPSKPVSVGQQAQLNHPLGPGSRIYPSRVYFQKSRVGDALVGVHDKEQI